MPIDRQQLLDDVHSWLPEDNILTDQQILQIGEKVIAEVGDDEDNYPEVLCKTLRDCAIANKALDSVSGSSIKREKSYQREIEYQQNTSGNTWDDYIDQLAVLCPIFGYDGLTSKSALGFKINVPDPIRVPCGSPSYGRTGFDSCDCAPYNCSCSSSCR